MSRSTLQGTIHIDGSLTAKQFTPPDASIGDDAIKAGAKVASTKLEHQHRVVDSQPNGSANVARRVVVHVVKGATGVIESFDARNTTAATGGDSTSVDLLKNGVSVLSAAVVLDAAAGTTLTAGTVNTTALAQGDVLEVEYTLSGSNVGNGGMGAVNLREDAQ